MNDATYTHWQELHRRVAAGETITPDEQTQYEVGCQEIDATVPLNSDLRRLQELNLRMDAVEDKQRRLREQETQHDSRIAALESQLEALTRQRSHIGN